MPVLFKEISGELGLDLVQIGVVWGMISFGSIFVMPIGGLLSDRLGVKRTLVLFCFLAGLTGALRGISDGYISLIVTTFLWGVLSSASIPAISVVAGQSVSSRQQGLAQGVMGAGGGLGFAISPLISATILSPLLGGWRNVLFLYGGLSIIICLLWWFTIKEPVQVKSSGIIKPIHFRQALSYLLRLKAVWLLGLCLLAYYGCVQGVAGFLPLYLRGSGWDAAAADATLATYSGIGMLVVIPLTFLSDRIGSRKICLLGAFAVGTIGVGLLSVIHNEFVWVIVIILSVFGIGPPLITTLCLENKEIGSKYSATAVALVLAICQIGGFGAPPLGNSLASISYGLPFVFWAALALMGFILVIFIKEKQWKTKSLAL